MRTTPAMTLKPSGFLPMTSSRAASSAGAGVCSICWRNCPGIRLTPEIKMARKFTAEHAFALAKAFHQLTASLGDYRFDHWDGLTRGQRNELVRLQWGISKASGDFNPADMNHEIAREKAKDKGRAAPIDFRGSAHGHLQRITNPLRMPAHSACGFLQYCSIATVIMCDTSDGYRPK